MLEPYEFLDELEGEHRGWLAPFDGRYLRKFENLLKGNYEAAMTEAAVRRLLERQGVAVEPNEDLTGASKQPDLFCTHARQEFYVEVTCISIEKATKKTGLPVDPRETGFRSYSSLNDAFWAACKGKVTQCAGLDHPALVAVGTHHAQASALCVSEPHAEMLLTGETKIAWNLDLTTGSQAGDTYLSTELHFATFLKRDPSVEVAFRRGPIAGLLLCGFGVDPPECLGILHPNPEHHFDPAALENIRFCEVSLDRANGTLATSWAATPK